MSGLDTIQDLALTRLDIPGVPADYLEALFGKLRRLSDATVVGDWYGCHLSSVFQPIVDGASGKTVAHEAFVRCLGAGRLELSPWGLFSGHATDQQIVALDRLCRIIHTLNFSQADPVETPLFLNVHGRLLATVEDRHGYVFRNLLDAIDFPAERIVIETPLEASHQPGLLAFVLNNFRANGFRVAVNAASVAQAQRIAERITPDFIKVAADHLGHPHDSLSQQRWLRAIAAGTQTVITRVEHTLEKPLPIPVWLQGNAYGSPQPAR